MLTEPGVAVIRDTAGVGGADVVAGSRLELGNGRRGTVVLTRSPLCVVCLDDDGNAVEPKPRESWKIEFDERVFGRRYF